MGSRMGKERERKTNELSGVKKREWYDARGDVSKDREIEIRKGKHKEAKVWEHEDEIDAMSFCREFELEIVLSAVRDGHDVELLETLALVHELLDRKAEKVEPLDGVETGIRLEDSLERGTRIDGLWDLFDLPLDLFPELCLAL